MEKLRSLMFFERGQKISERQLVQMVAISVCGILLCMACLAGTTWAWFTVSLHSRENQIQVGQFSVSVAVAADGETLEQVGECYTLAQGEYTVTLTNTGTTNAGCILRLAQDGQADQEQIIPLILAGDALRDDPAQVQKIAEVSVAVYGPDATLTVQPLWGVVSAFAEAIESMTIGEYQPEVSEDADDSSQLPDPPDGETEQESGEQPLTPEESGE